MSQAGGEKGRAGCRWPLDRRESGFAAAALLLVTTFLVRGWMEEGRAAGEVTLWAGRPTASAPLRLAGMTDAPEAHLVAYARSLRISSFAAPPDRASAPLLEFAIPVPGAVCERVEEEIEARCGGPVQVRASLFTFDWERVTSMRAELDAPDALAMNSVASAWGSELRTWIIEPSAEKVSVEFPCLRPMRFSLTLPEALIEGRCETGAKTLRLVADLPPSLAPSLYMDGTREIALRAVGRRAEMRVEDGLVSASSRTVELKRRDQQVVFESASPGLDVDLVAGEGAAGRHLEVTGPHVKSVLVGEEEVLPTAFEQAEGTWLTVMGTLLGIALGALWSLIVSWPRAEER